MWHLAEVHAAITAGLARAAAGYEASQAVRGLDSLDELPLHAVIADILGGAEFTVHREVRYPHAHSRRRKSEGRRCDLVLTTNGRALEEPARQRDLLQTAPACPAGEALWMEVKVVTQFLEGGPNRGYATALQGPIWRDLQKIVADPHIEWAAQLVVLFTQDEVVARHDLAVTLRRANARGVVLDTPCVAGFPIGDRLGNGRCTVVLVGVRR